MYADNTTVTIRDRDINNAKLKLKQTINKIVTRFRQNKLSINLSKTHVIGFNSCSPF